jgi:membrane dipeptidase
MKIFLLFLISTSLFACDADAKLFAGAKFRDLPSSERVVLTQEAIDLTKKSLIVDGHNDLPWAVRLENDLQLLKLDFLKLQPDFHTDIPRLVKGGLGAQFWSAYVDVGLSAQKKAYEVTLEQMDFVHRFVNKYSTHFEMASDATDILRIRERGKIASLIGIEGGHQIENSLEKLHEVYRRGARYMTLTHSKNTEWADSATDTAVHNGLTSFGKDIVREMNQLGMLVDISHVSAKTMKDAIETSSAPVIASHSSAYTILKHVRNVPDDVLKLLPKNGGVVMVNFYSGFVCEKSAKCSVKDVVNHIDHIVKVAGIDHVGLGSDFDGVPALPDQLTDVSYFPYITQELLNRKYSHGDIRKILGDNLIRAYQQVLVIASGAKQSRRMRSSHEIASVFAKASPDKSLRSQ